MLLVENRKARQEYHILESMVAGVVLTGGEVKSLRKGSGSFAGSFVRIVGNELFLLNAQITPYKFAEQRDYDPTRTRKLLVKKREILTLQEKLKQTGATLIPQAFELLGRNIKLRFGVARGKKQYERRAELKKKDIERDVQRELKQRVKIR